MSSTTTGVADATDRIARLHTESPDLVVGVQVPATSANLGPGYDALGVALDIPLVAVAATRQPQRVLPVGLGAEELPTDDTNLVWQGVLAWCEHAGTTPPDVSVQVRSAIPLERGLGSSSAAAVAGLALGRALTGGSGSAEVMLGLANELEGHPDNAAAAISGGLTLCLGPNRFRRFTPDGGLRPVLVVPSARQATREARRALPETVPVDVAAANGARAAGVLAALAGLTPLTPDLMVDQLHEPPRLALMSLSGQVVAALREAHLPTALSGAGPTVLAILPSGDDDALQRLLAAVAEVDDTLEVVPTRWDLAGVQVCPPGPRPT